MSKPWTLLLMTIVLVAASRWLHIPLSDLLQTLAIVAAFCRGNGGGGDDPGEKKSQT